MGPAQLAAPVCLSFARCLASAVAGQEQHCSTSLSNKAKDAHLRQPARCIQSALERLTSPPAVDNDIAEVVAARWHAKKSHLLFYRNNQARVGEAAWNKGTTVYFWRGVTGMLFLFSVAILFTSVPKSGVHWTLHITIPPPPPALSIFLFLFCTYQARLQLADSRHRVYHRRGERVFY